MLLVNYMLVVNYSIRTPSKSLKIIRSYTEKHVWRLFNDIPNKFVYVNGKRTIIFVKAYYLHFMQNQAPI